jgi:hypothetical protein
MAVHTSVFGAVRLSGDEAKKFSRQVAFGRPKQAAVQGLLKGTKLLKEYDTKGFVKISLKK